MLPLAWVKPCNRSGSISAWLPPSTASKSKTSPWIESDNESENIEYKIHADVIIEKIAQGKLQKFFKDNTLLSQPFVKDSSLTVEKYLGSYSADLTVNKFIRVSIG